MTSYIIRDGKSVPADEVFEAWTLNDLNKMLANLNTNTHPIDRHFLLQGIISETYKQRKDISMRKICIETCEIYLKEWPILANALGRDFNGQLPRILVFPFYATILTEDQEFEKAIEICEIAIKYQLYDGTKSGFDGRIERIIKGKNKFEKINGISNEGD